VSERIHRTILQPEPAAREMPPLLFTHGFGDDSDTWREQLSAFSPRHRMLCWDLPGHGRSARPAEAEAYSREIALGDLEHGIDLLGPMPVLVGHSLGGYLSQCHAVRHPGSVRALVLIATGPGYRDPAGRDEWNRGVGRIAHRFDVPTAAVRLVEQHDGLVMERLDALTMPVLVMAGERDRAYHAGIDYLERRLPNVRRLIVPGAGHHVHATHPAQVNEAIGEFLLALD
jgi:pimeloyl-ACP methyl ester carboxylesterase